MKYLVPSLLLMCGIGTTTTLDAVEFSGWIAIQGQVYADDGLNDQEQTNISIAAQPEWYHDFAGNWETTVELFGRLDQEDDERSHFDVREAHVLGIYDNWEFKFGISKEYWGATELAHLVDVINQTDAVENIDGEDKFGQAMLKATWYDSWGSIEAFILPGFRERSFPGEDGRLQTTPFVIDTDNAAYESGAEEWHTDAALRFNGNFDSFDIGLGLFNGTNRDPLFIPGANATLRPYYEQMTQASIDTTIPIGGWLIKGEAIYRDSTSDEYSAATGGFEYTSVGIFNSDIDLGFLSEYIWDERGDDATTFLQNDLFLGARLTFNNTQDTAILGGVAIDLDGGGQLITLELEHRINDQFTIEIQARAFEDAEAGDALYELRDDDYLQVEVFYNF